MSTGEFAENFRKIGSPCRVDVGIDPYGINYSRFIYGLKKSGIEMNRKALSELAIADPEAFKVLVETAKKAL